MPIERHLDKNVVRGGKAGDTVAIGDMDFTLIDLRKKKTRPTVVICADLTMPLLCADNRTGQCADCGTALQWRPEVPDSPKVCCHCGDVRMLSAARKDGDDLRAVPLMGTLLKRLRGPRR